MSTEIKNEQIPQNANITNSTMETKDDLINALKQGFATTVNKIYVNSLKREVGFREITVLEQKQLSRIMIDNDGKNRKDVVYDAQCALINVACLEKDSFNIYQLSEFDRLKLLIALYQANMFKNDVKFTCEECGAENAYRMDFTRVLERLDAIDLTPSKFNYENQVWNYDFTIEYPTVKRVLQFYKSYSMKYRGAKRNEIKSLESTSNIDYINLFISNIVLTNKNTQTAKTIDMNSFAAGDVEEILATFPQDVMYAENGVLQYIVNEYVKKVNDSFDQQKCYNCGAVHANTVSNAESFL